MDVNTRSKALLHQDVINLVVVFPIWAVPCPSSGWFVRAKGVCQYTEGVNRGTCCLKKCFNTERLKGIFVREKSIVNENALNSEGSLLHYKVCPSNYLFQLFLTL